MLHPDYPFAPRRVEIRPGIALSYLDEGPRDGEVVVMLHGNPSWSYYWRRLVLGLRDRYRCIVPDHVGMGLSDKPDDGGGVRQPDTPRADGDATARYDYTLASRIDDLQALLRHAGIDDATPVTLVVHDWGGMVGMGWALRDWMRALAFRPVTAYSCSLIAFLSSFAVIPTSRTLPESPSA